MKAVARISETPGGVELREMPEPTLANGEVLVEVSAAGVCGSDLEAFFHGKHASLYLPMTLGHEFSGMIRALGPGVDENQFQIGDAVTSETAYYICGKCALCRSGNYNLCRTRRGFGFGESGGFAPRVHVPIRCLHRIPKSVPLDFAAMTEPFCVAYHALIVNSPGAFQRDDAVVILGSGPIGLCAAQVAKAHGARVVVSGIAGDERRLQSARESGVDAVRGDTEELRDWVKHNTDGEGAPFVVDAVGGTPATFQQALDLVRPNGFITKIGWFKAPLNFAPDALLAKAITFRGSFSHNWPTWERVLQLFATGELNPAPLITHRFPLDQWREAFDVAGRREGVKVLLVPSLKA